VVACVFWVGLVAALIAAVVLPILLVGLLAAVWLGFFFLGFPYFERVRPHHRVCLKCGYDLRGLPEPVTCPECGDTEAQTDQVLRRAGRV
jgi:hypothetical protein